LPRPTLVFLLLMTAATFAQLLSVLLLAHSGRLSFDGQVHRSLPFAIASVRLAQASMGLAACAGVLAVVLRPQLRTWHLAPTVVFGVATVALAFQTQVL
jgi:hypothetical protein